MLFRLGPLPLAVAFTLPFQVHAAEDPAATLQDVTVSASPLAAGPASGANRVGEAGIAPLRAATSDTASLLGTVPGVSLYGAGGVSSLPAIHGLADDRLRVKVDGMDLVSACANHMNPPLSYIDPSQVGAIEVFSGIVPVSAGGDSIGGAILASAPEPEFAAPGQDRLLKGQLGAFYRGNGHARGASLSATIASDKLNVSYSGATTQSENYTAGGNFKPAGPAFVASPPGGPSLYTSTTWLDGDEVGSSMYKSTNQSLGFALQHENHLLELKLGYQDIPYQGFPNQRMDMTGNTSDQANLRYTGQYRWGELVARIYSENTRHEMNFLENKAYWYRGNAPGMPMNTEGKTTGALLRADIALSARDLLRVGGEAQYYTLDDWWSPSGTMGMSPNTFWNINDGRRDRLGLFGEWEARWSTRWLSQLGIRAETVKMDAGTVQGYNAAYNGDANAFNASDRSFTDHNWDLTALARYTPSAEESFAGGFARKTRSPNLYERYAWSTGGMAMNMVNLVGDGNGYVGNLDLKPEVANTLSATADWHDAAEQNWGLKITPYYTYVQDYVNARRCGAGDTHMAGSPCAASVNQTATDRFVFLKYLNQDARLYGFDISGYFPLAKRTGFGDFSATGLLGYVRGKTTGGADDNLYNIMPLNVKLAVIQRMGGWTNSVEGQFVSAKTDVSQVRNEIRTAGYGLLNLRGSYDWKRVRLDIGIDNALDKFYSLPLGGAYVGQGITMPPGSGAGYPPYGVAVPGMGRSIYAGVNVKF